MAFDVITPAFMGAAELTAGLATIRTTAIDSRDLVKTIDIANNGAIEASVAVHLVASGDMADNSNILVPTVAIPANAIFQWSGVQVMNAGTTIQASSTTADVCIQISGGEAV